MEYKDHYAMEDRYAAFFQGAVHFLQISTITILTVE